MKWKSLEFINIQSWENGKIDLNQNGLTVIEAKSETGKSVFIKCIRLGLYFEQYDARMRKSIIRNYPENEYGDFGITLEDNTKVCFRFMPTNVISIIAYPDGTVEKVERGNIEKIAKLLNLITCTNSFRILNILDNESPMLYDTTDMEYNTKIMELYLDHADLRNRKDLAREILRKLEANERNVKYLYNEYSRKLTTVQSNCDLDNAEALIQRCKQINNDIVLLEGLAMELEQISCLSKKNVVDISALEDNISSLKLHSEVINYLSYIFDIKEKSIISENVSESLKRSKQDYSFYNNLFKILESVNLYTDRKNLVDTDNLGELLTSYKNLVGLKDTILTLQKNVLLLNDSYQAISKSEKDLSDFKSINTTCPLCGQVW